MSSVLLTVKIALTDKHEYFNNKKRSFWCESPQSLLQKYNRIICLITQFLWSTPHADHSDYKEFTIIFTILPMTFSFSHITFTFVRLYYTILHSHLPTKQMTERAFRLHLSCSFVKWKILRFLDYNICLYHLKANQHWDCTNVILKFCLENVSLQVFSNWVLLDSVCPMVNLTT